MKSPKILILGLFFILTMFTVSGCRLAFEPAEDAVSRLLVSMPTGDNIRVREMCDGEDVCQKLNRLAGLVRSEWYNAQKGFYELEEVEFDEETKYSYVHVKLRIPASGSQRETTLPLVFEMERIKLRWHIYSVDGIEEFLRRAERARGIL
ncbi:MAG: hypothetical protein J6A01_11560 [Proteobacteria bacterium]|nr:hypothetical protein [Pseudomonadota bacterium]